MSFWTELEDERVIEELQAEVEKLESENQELKVAIKYLEDKVESGLLVELPCRMDEDVYYITNMLGMPIIACTQLANLKGYQIRNPEEFGYYIDRTQADARLKELQEQSNG